MRDGLRVEKSELLSGAVVAAIALAFLIGSFEYRLGTSRLMGPGYFPLVVAVALLILAPFIALGRSGSDPTEPPARTRPILSVVMSIAAFALTIELLGVVPALLLSSWCAYLQFPQSRKSALGFAAFSLVLAAVLWGVFSVVLGLPIPAFERLP